VKYLTAAGRIALAKHANREAANYLSAALERLDEDAPAEADVSLMEDLARARQRLGEYDSAMALLERLREDATRTEEWARLAAIERRIGLACYWTARFPEALEHYELGIAAAKRAGAEGLQARLQLNKGIGLQELGRAAEAKIEIESALVIAERMGDNALLARVQRSLLLLYLWTGPAERAREHGMRAIALAESAGHRAVAFQAHWAMAALSGLTGDAEATKRHIVESERIAEELHSPVLRIWTAEIAIEYASFTGDWDAGIAMAERTISLARGLGRTLVPRLLVWSSIMYLGRGELERARQYIEEAWQLSGAAGGGNRGVDVHTVVPAHTGLAAYHLATGNYEEAVRIGKAGLAIADSTGYVVWAIHRLLPTIAEASLWANDLVGAAWIGKRLRRDSERLGQKLGLAWADGCDALVAMLRGQSEAAVGLLRQAAEQLEAIPFVADAARIRRQLARALTETGDREGAMRELRRAHDVFAKLGAERELQATRAQLRDLGGRPPVRSASTGAHGLTGREIDIVRLVAERKSNKEIGQALGISPRTVSTHLSNIFPKLSVTSRAELTDYVRAKGLPQEEAPA
jgi:DNA-binding CsgD family transcriptional regulator